MHSGKIVFAAFVASLLLGGGLLASGSSQAIAATAGITLFTAILWVTEALPIPVTSLIPFVAFPIAGVLTHKQAASALGSHVILLLMGAFMLSKGIEKSMVHRRFALFMLRLTGGQSAKRLVFAFMLTAGLLSMWISNTATTLMLLPIALALLPKDVDPRLATALLLGIAYAASVGGVGTPIGTPPNVIFVSVYQEHLGSDYHFVDWMKTGVPVVLLALPLMALWLTRNLGQLPQYELPQSGRWQSQERRVLMVFGAVAIAWVSRPWWGKAFDLGTVGDSTIALAGVVAMFMVSAGKDRKDEKLLDWQTANSIPWGMLLLFAGGICIAKAFSASGLSGKLGDSLEVLQSVPVPVMILALCLFVTFLTEITSNTATATLLMPVLAVTGTAMNIDPALLMIPAAISASCAFMLPVATAPNAIVYGTERFTIKTMAREGVVLNLILAGIIATVSYFTL